ncbi:hypothetical protein PUN28_010000 [Cardiocondyla obscurior]|uniref:Uncharacterized protein n=1 Tax=Cardiocondyla obscurior TaxID=286306 RepID=A0AAW2FMW4_9HYME
MQKCRLADNLAKRKGWLHVTRGREREKITSVIKEITLSGIKPHCSLGKKTCFLFPRSRLIVSFAILSLHTYHASRRRLPSTVLCTGKEPTVEYFWDTGAAENRYLQR